MSSDVCIGKCCYYTPPWPTLLYNYNTLNQKLNYDYERRACILKKHMVVPCRVVNYDDITIAITVIKVTICMYIFISPLQNHTYIKYSFHKTTVSLFSLTQLGSHVTHLMHKEIKSAKSSICNFTATSVKNSMMKV